MLTFIVVLFRLDYCRVLCVGLPLKAVWKLLAPPKSDIFAAEPAAHHQLVSGPTYIVAVLSWASVREGMAG